MIPSRWLVLLATLPVAVSLLILVDNGFRSTVLATDACLVAIALVDAALSWLGRIEVERECSPVFSLGRANRVRLRVRSTLGRRVTVRVTDDVFDTGESNLPMQVELAARGRAELSYDVVPRRRGLYRLGDHTVRYPSPLGLWIRQRRIRAADEVRVHPDLLQIRGFELLARRNHQADLARATRLRGGESEFERLREYAKDDEPRFIDWKATARHGKPIVREHRIESDQTVMFVLDSGRLMTAEMAGLSRFDHALNASLMLAHVAARGGDRVGLLAFDSELRAFVAPATGTRAVAQMVEATYDLHPRMLEPDFDLSLTALSNRVRRRSLVIVMTHLVDEVAASALVRRVSALRRRHLPLVITFRDGDVEDLRLPEREANPFVRGAAVEMLRWRESVLSTLRTRGCLVLDTAPNQLSGPLIQRYFEVKARHLL